MKWVAAFWACLVAAFLFVALTPSFDLAASALFYRAGEGFYLADHPVFVFLHKLAVNGAWALGIGSLLAVGAARLMHKPVAGITMKGWSFLFLALIIGPVLIANVGFKDHWGRARPREVVEFGGAASFSPALVPQAVATKNGSFVSGDGSFGFFLPAFAYVVSSSRSRRFFWGGMAGGMLFGGARLVMGAHFLSDILAAAFLMLASSALLHAVMFGKNNTRALWRAWFYGN